tara:strand:- start:745 stop:933 length:189 start_codon:yes stop_codon:yes gene_type:complete
MLTIITVLGMFVGYEGQDDENLYVGMYTPQCEYGYIIKKDFSDFWLDSTYSYDYNTSITTTH